MSKVDILEDIKIDEKIEKDIKEPKKYKVIMLNDDKTPMDWVIEILKIIFKHSQETAEKITLTIHNEGSGLVGVYTYEIAEQKTAEAITASRENGFPLVIKMEKE
jgi:ATP-dependent Clp protease adaptor protein ClpS